MRSIWECYSPILHSLAHYMDLQRQHKLHSQGTVVAHYTGLGGYTDLFVDLWHDLLNNDNLPFLVHIRLPQHKMTMGR